MVQNKHVINSLPLIAAVLGRKYGVQVHINGDKAFTDGKSIHLPSLPSDGDKVLLGLARGFIDHESAHIRHTDFTASLKLNLSPLEHHICNMLEDWRVERDLAKIFPGCAHNFTWLIKHFLLDDEKVTPGLNSAQQVLQWLMLTVASWTVAELSNKRAAAAQNVEHSYPGLLAQLTRIMQNARARCVSTFACAQVAQEICMLLKQYCKEHLPQLPQGHDSGNVQAVPSGRLPKLASLKQLEILFNSDGKKIPKDMGENIAEALHGIRAQNNEHEQTTVAIATHKDSWELSAQHLQQIQQATNSLSIRLQALMQSHAHKPVKHAFHGKLDTRKHASCAHGPFQGV